MQTHPRAPEFSRIPSQVRSYGVLAVVSNCCPPLQGRFSTYYSPVRHFPLTEVSFSFDLHVWSTPPAFVLSQDQTLHCQKVYVHRLMRANSLNCSTLFLCVIITLALSVIFFRINKYCFVVFSYSVFKVRKTSFVLLCHKFDFVKTNFIYTILIGYVCLKVHLCSFVLVSLCVLSTLTILLHQFLNATINF